MSCAKDFVNEEEFVMYLGDAIYGSSLVEAAELFAGSDCANVDLVKPVPDPERFGVANTEGGRIVKLVEKPKQPESNLAMAGVYFFRKQIWEVLPDLRPSARGEYEITDAIQLLIDNGHEVRASVYDGEWFDTGTLGSFLACSSKLLNGGVRIGEGADVDSPVGASVCVGERATVVCDGIEDSVVLPGASVEASGPIRHSILGGHVKVQGEIVDAVLYG
jgi:glucose-1-phosphate thymidylyltransferase